MKISFDFDKTLSRPDVQEYCKKLIKHGVEVWVVTSRFDDNHVHRWPEVFPGADWLHWYEPPNIPNWDLYQVTDNLGIPRHRIRFTCMEDKWRYLHRTTFIWHLDDNYVEFERAEEFGCTVPFIDVTQFDWKKQCNTLLAPYKNGTNAKVHSNN